MIRLMFNRSASVFNVDGLAVTQIQINRALFSQEIRAFYSNIKKELYKRTAILSEKGSSKLADLSLLRRTVEVLLFRGPHNGVFRCALWLRVVVTSAKNAISTTVDHCRVCWTASMLFGFFSGPFIVLQSWLIRRL